MPAGNRAESKDERNQRRAVANVFASKAISGVAAAPALAHDARAEDQQRSSEQHSDKTTRRCHEQQPGAQQPEYWAHVCATLSPARQRFQRASGMSALEPSVPTGVSRIKAALRTCSATW